MRHGDVLLKVLLELFQKLVGAAAIGGRPPQRAKLPYPSKAPPKGEFSPKAKRGDTFACGKGGERFAIGEVNTSQVGGSPFPIKAYLNRLFAFFFETRGANENCFASLSRGRKRLPELGKKDHAVREVSPCAATNAPRVGSAVAF